MCIMPCTCEHFRSVLLLFVIYLRGCPGPRRFREGRFKKYFYRYYKESVYLVCWICTKGVACRRQENDTEHGKSSNKTCPVSPPLTFWRLSSKMAVTNSISSFQYHRLSWTITISASEMGFAWPVYNKMFTLCNVFFRCYTLESSWPFDLLKHFMHMKHEARTRCTYHLPNMAAQLQNLKHEEDTHFTHHVSSHQGNSCRTRYTLCNGQVRAFPRRCKVRNPAF